jgi:hypothetical protein
MARLSPDNPDNTRTQPDLSGDILTRTDRTNAFRHVRLSGVRLASNPEDRGPRNFEVKPINRKCRIHGGLSPGAPRGVANGRYTDGYWTREAVEERRFIRLLLKGTLGGKS